MSQTQTQFVYGKGKTAACSAAAHQPGSVTETPEALFPPQFLAQSGDLRVDFVNNLNISALDQELHDELIAWLSYREQMANKLREIDQVEATLAAVEAELVAATPPEKYKAGSAAERTRLLNAIVHSDRRWLDADFLLKTAVTEKRELSMSIDNMAQVIKTLEVRLRWRTSYTVSGVLNAVGPIKPDQVQAAVSLQ